MENYTYYGSQSPSTTIIYIHGGAYVMGNRFDLPKKLSELLTKNNRALITIDYPLAPQVKYEEIVLTVTQLLNDLIIKYKISNLILMGRSAGSNIMLSLDPQKLKTHVQSLISFYGYASLETDWMNDEILNLDVHLNTKLVNTMKDDHTLVYQRDIQTTYLYYANLRKTKQWVSTVGFINKEILWPNNIPLFIAHSIYDPDVPYRCSFVLKNHFKRTTSYTSTSKQHAFDHDPLEQDELFHSLITYLDNFS